MARGHSGFISIYENGQWGAGDPYHPQALVVDSESLQIRKSIFNQDNIIQGGRAYEYYALVSGPESPEGAISMPFKTDQASKIFYSHFQFGSSLTTGTTGSFHYRFYPSKGNPNYESGLFGDGTYGGTGFIYSVSFLKKFVNKNEYGGTNSMFFKWGVCDSFEFSCLPNEEAHINAEFKFRNVDDGTAVGTNIVPGTAAVGSYTTTDSIPAFNGTILFGGNSFEISGLKIKCANNIEPQSRLGARNPEYFMFGRHDVTGEFSMDLPNDGLKWFGSMLGTNYFTLQTIFMSSETDYVSFYMPYCRYMPFESNNSGDSIYNLTIPFKSYEFGTFPAIQVDVRTNRSTGILYWDATFGERGEGFPVWDESFDENITRITDGSFYKPVQVFGSELEARGTYQTNLFNKTLRMRCQFGYQSVSPYGNLWCITNDIQSAPYGLRMTTGGDIDLAAPGVTEELYGAMSAGNSYSIDAVMTVSPLGTLTVGAVLYAGSYATQLASKSIRSTGAIGTSLTEHNFRIYSITGSHFIMDEIEFNDLGEGYTHKDAIYGTRTLSEFTLADRDL